jgi:putative endopeptidase
MSGCFTSCKQETIVTKPDVVAVNLDTTISPSDDFFSYANGGWIKGHPIPAEQISWGIGNLVIEENLKRLRTLSEDAAKSNAAKGSAQQKIGDFWLSAMDSADIEKQGLKFLQPLLDEVAEVKDNSGLAKAIGDLHKNGIGTVLGIYASQDDKNSESMALHFFQYGLFLGEREYYFKMDSSHIAIREAYKNLITTQLRLSGADSVSARLSADNILALETRIASAHRKLEDTRDPFKNYYKFSKKSLFDMMPAAFLPEVFSDMHITGDDSVIVHQPEYYQALQKELKSTPITHWKGYLQFRIINSFARALPDTFGRASFAFRSILYGAKERKPRWKRVMEDEEDQMGELLGQLFVKEYFNETAKKRYSDLVEDIREAYRLRINKLEWMSDSTRKIALDKLDAMKKKVGYPDKWKDFSSMEISRESYVQNLLQTSQWWFRYNISKLGKPVDRDEWDMSPQTYNAYYNPSNNEIVLPAGIFTVPGFRDEELDDAVVFGYAGASTIGHEITHGFDDQGKSFDAKGNLRNWWTKEDEEKFNKRADVMVKQFNSFVVVDTFRINGKATLGENMADLGGILLGWDAFTKTEQYKKNEQIAGLTPAQRYFLGYSLGWLSQTRKERLRDQVLADVHSPAKFRVNGPFSSVDAFYNTFNIPVGSKMFLADSSRVRVW